MKSRDGRHERFPLSATRSALVCQNLLALLDLEDLPHLEDLADSGFDPFSMQHKIIRRRSETRKAKRVTQSALKLIVNIGLLRLFLCCELFYRLQVFFDAVIFFLLRAAHV